MHSPLKSVLSGTQSSLTTNLTGRFHVAMGLFSNRSPVTSKFGKNKAQLPVSLMFLPHFDLLCDLFLYRPTDTWNQLRHGLMLLWFKDLMNVTEKWVCSSAYPIKIVFTDRAFYYRGHGFKLLVSADVSSIPRSERGRWSGLLSS